MLLASHLCVVGFLVENASLCLPLGFSNAIRQLLRGVEAYLAKLCRLLNGCINGLAGSLKSLLKPLAEALLHGLLLLFQLGPQCVELSQPCLGILATLLGDRGPLPLDGGQIFLELAGGIAGLQQGIYTLAVCFGLCGRGVRGRLSRRQFLVEFGVHVLHEAVHDLDLIGSQPALFGHSLKRVERGRGLLQELRRPLGAACEKLLQPLLCLVEVCGDLHLGCLAGFDRRTEPANVGSRRPFASGSRGAVALA